MSDTPDAAPVKRGRGAAFHRPAGQRLLDLVREADWYCQGVPVMEIARRIGLDQMAIHRDLRQIRTEWANRRDAFFGAHVAEELAKLDQLEKQAWQAWYWSTQKRKSAEREKEAMLTKDGQPVLMANGKGQKFITTNRRVKVQSRDGDPRFLVIVYQCIDRRIKMLGLDAPVKVQQEAALRDLAQVVAAETGQKATDIVAAAERIAQNVMARQQQASDGMDLDADADADPEGAMAAITDE